MSSSKKCFKCGIEKPIDQFYRHPKMADGHLNKCKSCAKNDVSRHREENIDKIREYDRGRAKRPERVKQAIHQTRKWRQADSRRSAAHNAVARALKAGLLHPKGCEWKECGKDAMAHHESYDRPLDVVWYCQAHHKKRHAEMRKLNIEP